MASEFTQHPWPGSTRTTNNGDNWIPSPPRSPTFSFVAPESPTTIGGTDRKYHYSLPSTEDEEATLTSQAHHTGSSWSTWESAGLEVVPDDCWKEVVEEKKQDTQPDYLVETHGGSVPSGDDGGEWKGKRNSASKYVIAAIVLMIIALALGLGLGLGLGLKKHRSPKDDGITYYSTSGAFNGSGIALASESFGGNSYGSVVIYFQHWTGSLRYMALEAGSWAGGDITTMIATDVRNGTPISAVSYAMDGKSTWHIFYLNKDSMVREKVNSNTTNVWIDGPLNALNLQAMDDPNVGLQACWYGSFYGDANYSHSPIPGTGSNTTSPDSVVGMHLWYGTSNSTIQEYEWTYGTSTWIEQQVFPANGHAGIACYSWGPGSVSYTMMVDLDSEVQVMWKDLNPNATATAAHPLGTWVNSTVSIPAYQNTSLGYTNYFYLQDNDTSINGYNMNWAAENTSVISADNFTIQIDNALPGTHMSVSALPTMSGGNSLLVFNQVEGNDVTEFTRDITAGQWTWNSLPIPDT